MNYEISPDLQVESEAKETVVAAEIPINDGIHKEASGRHVYDVGSTSGRAVYGKSLDAAIAFLWEKVNRSVDFKADSKLSIQRAASYYGEIDKAISTIVRADVAALLTAEDLSKFEEIRVAINKKHEEVLKTVFATYAKPPDDECPECGTLLYNGKCVVCKGNSEMVKEASSPVLQFFESGFIVGMATDIMNYVVTSGMNLTDAINTAKDSFGLTKREEYRLRKYLNYMGMFAPQMIWLPPSETRFS